MRLSESMQLKARGCRHQRHLYALGALAAKSSCGSSLRRMVLSRRGMSVHSAIPAGVTVQVVAWLPFLRAGFGLIAAKLIVDAVTVDFGQLRLLEVIRGTWDSWCSYLFRKPRFHRLQSRASWRWREVMVSSQTLQAAMVGTADVLFDTGDAVVAVVVGIVVVAAGVVPAALVVCRDSRSHLGQRSHERVNVDNKLKRAVAGRRPGPERYRVPYWQDASP